MTICPYCEQGVILEAKVKKITVNIKICPECEVVWEGDVAAEDGFGYEIFMEEHRLKNGLDEFENIKEYIP